MTEKPVRYPPSRYDHTFDVTTLTTPEECLAALAEIDEERGRIEGHLGAAITRFHETGVRQDPQWFGRANNALRMKGRHRQRVQERLGMLRRAERQANGVSSNAQAHAFRYAARQLLAPKTIAKIEALAIARMRDHGVLGELPDPG